MASADTLGAKTRLDDLASTARFVFIGLVWGTAMLCTVGAWLRTKYEPAQIMWANVFLIAAAVGGLLALWQAFTLWIKNEPAEQKTATLSQQQGILSMALMAAGLGLIVMGFVVGLVKKPGWPGFGFVLENLPESLGVLIFGLIALGSGYALSTPRDQAGGASLIRWLTQATQLLKLILLIVSLKSLGIWVYLVYKKGEFFSSVPVPEHTALLLISIVSFGCLLWLNTGAFDEVGTRLLVLVFGGGVGLIFFLTTLFRAYLWRQDIFLGGSDAWQGANAWHFWLCAYALFFSLVVIFASLIVARADIRTSVVLRRVLYGYDALAQAFLLFGILFVLNVVVYARFPLTFDWTKTRGAYALSDSSKFLLSKLKEEANVYVILPQNHPAYKDLRVLLENCHALSDQKFKVNYLAGDFDQKLYRDLAKRFPVILPDPLRQSGGRGVLVVYGALPADPKQPAPHAFIADTKILTDEDGPRGVRPKRMFKGESEILKELKFLAQGKQKRKIYFLQGFDDMSISNMGGGRRRDVGDGFSQVGINLLSKRLEIENHEVFGLSFRVEIPGQKAPPNLRFAKEEGAEKKKEIPDDCHTLVVAGVSRPLPPEVLGALERYMERDSKNTMLVFLDVVTEPDYSKLKESGLEPFLKRFGVEVTNEFTLGMPQHARDDPAELIAKAVQGTDNPLARQFAGFPIGIKNSARVVRPVEATRYKAETILILDKGDLDWFIEKDTRVLRNPMNHFLELLKNNPQKLRAAIAPDSISIAVAVTESKGDKPRMLVFGDAEFISNVELSQGRINNDFTISALEWTAEREGMIGPQPKVTSYYSIGAAANIPRMILLPGWLMLLTLIGLGVGIWVVRRR